MNPALVHNSESDARVPGRVAVGILCWMTSPDERELLREGDALLKAGDVGPAARIYAIAARAFEQRGHALKAVAVWRHVRDLIAKLAPPDRELDTEARRRLPSLYRALGMHDEADAVENES